MAFRLYNTLTRTTEPFAPLHPPAVTMYVCGPTVYDDPHIGHARSAYIFDVLRRYLVFKKYDVRFIRNVTDVDDKIIEKARQETGDQRQETKGLKERCAEVAERYLKSYHETLDRLGLGQPTQEPRATAHVVPDMTDYIAKLLVQGAAYEAGGDVYFSVRNAPGYGQLSNRSVDELQAGARVEPDEQKRDPLDFALWKAAKPDEPSWNSPWGAGRPGWHIECTVMSTKYLGEAFDIHGGGVDLVFPHHENEIAQARGVGHPFARWWVHNGLLTVKGEKMSKSLGNYITVDAAVAACGMESDVLKTLFLGTHYRSPLDYTDHNLLSAKMRYERLVHFLRQADQWRDRAQVPSGRSDKLVEAERQFTQVLDEDLNTPQALAVLDKVVEQGNRSGQIAFAYVKTDPAMVQTALGEVVAAADQLLPLGNILGLFSDYRPLQMNAEVRRLLQERRVARERKDFQAADRIREELAKRDILVEDTAHGSIPIPMRRGGG